MIYDLGRESSNLVNNADNSEAQRSLFVLDWRDMLASHRAWSASSNRLLKAAPVNPSPVAAALPVGRNACLLIECLSIKQPREASRDSRFAGAAFNHAVENIEIPLLTSANETRLNR